MKDRKTMTMTIIAVVTLLILVIGATFAYFQAVNSASGTTTVTTKNETIGSVIVTNPTESLYLKLSSYDMQEANKGTSYYATEDSTANHSKGKENNVIAKYTISGGEQSTVYSCTFNMSVNKPSDIQSGDMTLKLTGLGAKINGLSSVSVDLASADSIYQVKFSRVGNGIGNLVVGDITFNNTETEQNYLEGKTLNSSVTLSGMECSIEKTEEPDLFEGTLTPVVYDGNNWKIVESTDKNWYDYENQEWANAVILKSDSGKGIGDTVSVEGDNPDVLAMYVWIPRYEYRIQGLYGLNGTSKENPGEVEIKFISKNTTVASEGYKVHPAFTLGGKELAGIWVGKFEIGRTSKTGTNMACTNTSCSEADSLRILPNLLAQRNNTVSSFYYAIKSMEQSNNAFGINGNTTDSHMIKSSEWGAVAYLSQSIYGKYGNDDFSNKDKEVYINNSVYYTGRSGGTYGGNVSNSTYGTYTYDGYLLNENTKTNDRNIKTVASTTGNVTGIYDMSGGTWEYTMDVFAYSNGVVSFGKSGFNGLPNEKYYNLYKAYDGELRTAELACNNGACYGHGITEMRGWYKDSENFVVSDLPWMSRGGLYNSGSAAGVFSIAKTTGGAAYSQTTRAVLTSKSISKQEYKTYENGEVVYFDVETGLKCTNYNVENSKTGYNGIDNRTGSQNSCLKFYAFNDNGGNKLNLLLDHNTSATSKWNDNGDNSTGPTEILTELNNATKSWKGTIEPSNYTTGVEGRRYTINYEGLNARLITANEIATITGNYGWYENNSGTVIFYFDTRSVVQSDYCKEGDTTYCRYGWLYDRTNQNCTVTGCLNNSDLETNGYWTASAVVTNSDAELHQEYCNGYVNYGVSDSGRLSNTCPNYPGHYGVRPVIEVNKEDLGEDIVKVCRLADDSEVAEGLEGAKYNCKVDPNKPEYTFYLLDNNDDGTSDLIMNANINSAGEEIYLNDRFSGETVWYEHVSEGDNRYGPVTAMEYLHNATKSWINIKPLNYEYYDRQVLGITNSSGYQSFISTNGIVVITGLYDTSIYQIGTVEEPVRTRMANITEIKSYDEAPFFYDNLVDEIDFGNSNGYWTLSSSNEGDSRMAMCLTKEYGNNVDFLANHAMFYGVRPVITVKL